MQSHTSQPSILLQIRHKSVSLFGTAFIATALTFSPVLIDQFPGVDLNTEAQAKKGNGGGGGGKSRGGSNRSSKSKSNRGHSSDQGRDHAKNVSQRGASQADKVKLKGSLNAAHASAMAREKAAPHSRVGMIATYEKAVLASSLTDAEATELSGLLSQLDDQTLTRQEEKALQAELAALVNNLEAGDVADPGDVETLAATALNSLQQASNKALDNEDKMIDAVNSLLGVSEPNPVVDRVKALSPEDSPDQGSDRG